jgi:hypothetical protein
MDSKKAVREYKKRFIIEEMFKDLKSYGFNMEGTWTEDIVYFQNLYLCLSIAYTWLIILGADCSKNKKSKIIGATKKLKNKVVRMFYPNGNYTYKMHVNQFIHSLCNLLSVGQEEMEYVDGGSGFGSLIITSFSASLIDLGAVAVAAGGGLQDDGLIERGLVCVTILVLIKNE